MGSSLQEGKELKVVVHWLFKFLEMYLLFTFSPGISGRENIQAKVSSLSVIFRKDIICCEEN